MFLLNPRFVASFFLPHSAFRIPYSVLVLALGIALALPAVVSAQPASPPTISKVRIGLPSGSPDSGRMRQGAWTPVYISLNPDPKGNGVNQFKVVLDALDAEDNPYRYSVPVPAMDPEKTGVVIGYLRAPSQEFSVSLQTVDGKLRQGPLKQTRTSGSEPLRPIMPLFVVMGGSKLPKLKEAFKAEDPKLKGAIPAEQQPTDDDTFNRCYARIDTVDDMPDRWFGYDAADVVILTTANNTFMNNLTLVSNASRRKALAEWVRRGGRLVLSVGRNHQFVDTMLQEMPFLSAADRLPLLPFQTSGSVQFEVPHAVQAAVGPRPPFQISGSVHRQALPGINVWAGVVDNKVPTFGQPGKDGKAVSTVEVAILTAQNGLGDGTNVLATDKAGDNEGKGLPLIVQSSCGLGRVLLIAFDVDAEPFNSWTGQKYFWIKVRDYLSGINPVEIKNALENFTGGDRAELLIELEKYIDTFDDVPVVSFGWVALFIFVYILIVGPLDYFILKKVFKRLELTWVTFPIVVLTISVGAYFIAYALKGDNLRVNKVDLVEIDLHTPQVYGTSWFSVFSPRMQNYTLGVEPAFKGSGSSGQPSTMVALLENPGATERAGSTSLFRQPYEYAEDATGIERVPIPVWSTRMFTASWRAPYPADKPPFRAELVRRDNGLVTGKIINELPVDLEDVCLFYHDRWYKLPNNRVLAAKGDLFDVTELGMDDRFGAKEPLPTWFSGPMLTINRTTQTSAQRRNINDLKHLPGMGWDKQKKDILFFISEEQRATTALNSGLRSVSQSWRLKDPFRDEVILIARTPYASGKAAKINDEGLVQLWNDRLPDPATPCPPLTGFLSQETYIRVYIPVKNP